MICMVLKVPQRDLVVGLLIGRPSGKHAIAQTSQRDPCASRGLTDVHPGFRVSSRLSLMRLDMLAPPCDNDR